jgi:hypothetical protein
MYILSMEAAAASATSPTNHVQLGSYEVARKRTQATEIIRARKLVRSRPVLETMGGSPTPAPNAFDSTKGRYAVSVSRETLIRGQFSSHRR